MSGVNHQQSHLTRLSSPAQIDPFYTQGYNDPGNTSMQVTYHSCRDDLTGNDLFQQCWVTVYG